MTRTTVISCWQGVNNKHKAERKRCLRPFLSSSLTPLQSFFSEDPSWFLGEKKCGSWTQQENKQFEKALARFDRDTPERWLMVARMIPGKTVGEVLSHYHDLEEDVSFIEAGLVPFPGYSSSSLALDWDSDLDAFKQDFSLCGKRSASRLSDHERKKGVPWTEEEHKRFLMGLKKYGKGDWRNISRNFVVTRTSTQVASHAQKYFLRLNSGGKDKRRASIHDITTVNMEDESPASPSQPSADANRYAHLPYDIQTYGLMHGARNPPHLQSDFSAAAALL